MTADCTVCQGNDETTALWCRRCKRTLHWDGKRFRDIVTPSHGPNPPQKVVTRFSHDGCGGDVALSKRQAKA